MQYFTEQGASASQVTAAKVMDVIAGLPDCDGQAAEEIAAYTQVKLEDAPKLLRIPRSECPDIWVRFPRHKWPTSWSNIEDPVVLRERHLYGHPLAGLFWEDSSRKFYWSLDGKKYRIREFFCVYRKQGLILSAHVDAMKMAGKKQNMAPMWKKMMKNVDLDEPTSFLDLVYLECTQRECKT